MKIFIKTFFIILLFSSVNAISQETDNFEKLIVNEWVLEKFEINGKEFPPKENHEKDKMIFTNDYKSISVSNGISQNGTWSYDKENGVLYIEDKNNKIKMTLNILQISKNNCILKLEKTKDQIITLYLKTE